MIESLIAFGLAWWLASKWVRHTERVRFPQAIEPEPEPVYESICETCGCKIHMSGVRFCSTACSPAGVRED